MGVRTKRTFTERLIPQKLRHLQISEIFTSSKNENFEIVEL